MGLTERHWFENESDVPENYEWALEDAVYNSCTNKKVDMINCCEGRGMIDREKIIKALEFEIARGKHEDWDGLDMITVEYETVLGAMELLKQPYRFGKWKRISSGMTPGGTPMYACAECGGTEHLYGAEYPQRYVICEQCGSINTYPWEVTIDEYRETRRKCK